MYFSAVMAAVVPSPQALVICLQNCNRTSPARSYRAAGIASSSCQPAGPNLRDLPVIWPSALKGDAGLLEKGPVRVRQLKPQLPAGGLAADHRDDVDRQLHLVLPQHAAQVAELIGLRHDFLDRPVQPLQMLRQPPLDLHPANPLSWLYRRLTNEPIEPRPATWMRSG